MILTKELLKQSEACQEGIDFCERNKLFGFDLDNFSQIKGDYNYFVEWLDYNVMGVILVLDEHGNVIERKNKDNDYWYIRYEYDKQQNLIRTQRVAGSWVEYSYDSNGNLITELWSTGHKIERKYDKHNNLIELKSPFGDGTQFFYNEHNQLIQEYLWYDKSYANLEYDEKGNVIKRSYDDGIGYSTWEYDENNFITKENTNNNEWAVYEYDDHYNTTKITFSDGFIQENVIEYYPNGQLKRFNDLEIPLI